jgi:hypothetical protein
MKTLKEKARHFFYENRLGKWIFRSMAFLNSLEGIVHLTVATLGIIAMFHVFGIAVITHLLFFGGFKAGMVMWGLMLPNIENLFFGVASLIFAVALGIDHHHHGHHDHKEDEQCL